MHSARCAKSVGEYSRTCRVDWASGLKRSRTGLKRVGSVKLCSWSTTFSIQLIASAVSSWLRLSFSVWRVRRRSGDSPPFRAAPSCTTARSVRKGLCDPFEPPRSLSSSLRSGLCDPFEPSLSLSSSLRSGLCDPFDDLNRPLLRPAACAADYVIHVNRPVLCPAACAADYVIQLNRPLLCPAQLAQRTAHERGVTGWCNAQCVLVMSDNLSQHPSVPPAAPGLGQSEARRCRSVAGRVGR